MATFAQDSRIASNHTPSVKRETMAHILVLYSSHDGQTRRIAARVAEVLERAGHEAELCSTDAPDVGRAIGSSDGVVVGAAVRYGHFAPRLQSVLRGRTQLLTALPNAFFAVCLTAGGPGAKPEVARGYVDDLVRRTGWQPADTAIFAGALRYRDYNPFIRLMMRLIVGHAGGDTDMSRDYEYTDWQAVERFAARFAARFAVPVARRARAPLVASS
jgi:menaquinone-dependent protoporphyrinogen oxidase